MSLVDLLHIVLYCF